MRVELPTLQNWSCHNCGGCCKQHAIEVTPEEQDRITKQGWRPADLGVRRLFESVGLFSTRKRLAHRDDGSCAFLDDRGLCKIHAKFGEAAKPLACRIYPYAFHPAGDKIALSLRYSCPTVAANGGATMAEQAKDVRAAMALVVPDGFGRIEPPPVHGDERLDWRDTLRITRKLDAALDDDEHPLPLRLAHLAFVARMLGQATFAKVRGPRVDELMDVLITNAPAEVPATDELPPPSPLAMTQFRLLVAQYARRDTFDRASRGLGYRLRMVRAGLAMARGRGRTPAIRPDLPSVDFAAIERSTVDFGDRVDELFRRYLRTKIQGLHFCGRAFYGRPIAEGFEHLLLVVPVTLYLARWLAVADGRSVATIEDVTKALTFADHPHGYSPALGLANARRRVRWIADHDELPKLIAWTAQSAAARPAVGAWSRPSGVTSSTRPDVSS